MLFTVGAVLAAVGLVWYAVMRAVAAERYRRRRVRCIYIVGKPPRR